MIHNQICKFFCILYFLGFISNTKCVPYFKAFPPTKSGYYIVGQSVNITCSIKNESQTILFARQLPSGRSLISEGGSLYNKYSKYKYIIENVPMDVKKHIIIIDKLEITDNGSWVCINGPINNYFQLNVKVIGELKSLLVERIESKGEEGLTKKFSNLLFGRGTRTNPYDLLRNRTVRITCTSSCSNLEIGHVWQYKNLSSARPPVKLQSPAPVQYEPCKFIKKGDGQIATSFVDVDCRKLQLVGSNEVSCYSKPYSPIGGADKFKSVYVLCPGGHQTWELTNAEIIGIFVAVTLCCVVVIVLFFSARRIITGGGSYNHGRYSTSIQGIRV